MSFVIDFTSKPDQNRRMLIFSNMDLILANLEAGAVCYDFDTNSFLFWIGFVYISKVIESLFKRVDSC